MKNFYSIIFIVLMTLTCSKGIMAQQDVQYTQYIYNTNIVNPAYAGTRGLLNITALHRSQWVGLEGAPETQTLNLNTPVGEKGIGLGFGLVNDNLGPVSEQIFNIDISYSIKTSNASTLAFGIKAGANLLNVDFNQLEIFDPNDQNLIAEVDNRFSPNIGTGVYYFSDYWYLGVSVPNILETSHFDGTSTSLASERQTFYLIGGYVFDLSYDWKFKPAILTKISSGTPFSTDVSANFLYRENLTLGASYRLDSAVSALVGFQLNKTWFIGYSYDTDTTDLNSFNGGSHELLLRVEVGRKARCGCFF